MSNRGVYIGVSNEGTMLGCTPVVDAAHNSCWVADLVICVLVCARSGCFLSTASLNGCTSDGAQCRQIQILVGFTYFLIIHGMLI